jgi:hypothetical protein
MSKVAKKLEISVLEERQELVNTIFEQIGNPISIWAVAATIESIGIRDIDVRRDFGCDSVFDLAEEIYPDLKQWVNRHIYEEIEENIFKKPSISERVFMFLRYYGYGLLFSLPMMSQLAAVLIFRYSLWAWLEFNEAQATMVAFGTIWAFIITGGFVQIIGRSVTKYISDANFFLAYESARKIVRNGALTTLVVALLFFVMNLVLPFYPQSMLGLALVYYVLISMLLLGSGVLYALQQRIMILFIILAGTAIVIAGMDWFLWGIYLSHWIGMGVTTLLLMLYAYGYLRFKIYRNPYAAGYQKLPDESVRYYLNYHYFAYGFLYFFFLFLDRILAWSAGPPSPPYIMWFNTPYELGMDWALISLILTIAVLEYSINAFSKQLLSLQKKTGFVQVNRFNRFFQKFYRRQIILLIMVGLVSIIATYFGINSLRVLKNDIPEIRDFFLNPMTTKVFWIAGISYLFVVIGLLHSLFFFRLNKPSFAVYAITGAFLVNFIVGFICSRIFGLEYAVIGLLAGSITFAAISGRMAKSFFERLDYYYYSAF